MTDEADRGSRRWRAPPPSTSWARSSASARRSATRPTTWTRTGLALRVGASALTLGGLLKHLAVVEDEVFTWRLAGQRPVDEWPHDDPGWPFTSAADDEPATLYRRWDAAVARSRARLAEVLATGGLEQPVHMGDEEQHANLARLLCDLVEEYGRHTGHADLLREAVDGRVGEDPPDGWRPVSGLSG